MISNKLKEHNYQGYVNSQFPDQNKLHYNKQTQHPPLTPSNETF